MYSAGAGRVWRTIDGINVPANVPLGLLSLPLCYPVGYGGLYSGA